MDIEHVEIVEVFRAFQGNCGEASRRVPHVGLVEAKEYVQRFLNTVTERKAKRKAGL
jgi:hypothetical protein